MIFLTRRALPFALAALAAGAREDTPPTNADALRKLLKTDHPRLLVSDSDVERARRLGQSDPFAKQVRESLIKEGERILKQPPVEYKLIGPRLLDKSRTCLARVYTLATLYRLDGDTRWSDRAKKEMLAVAAFPDWHPDHFLDTAELCHAFAIGYDWLFQTFTPDERATIRTALIDKGLKIGKLAYEGAKYGWWKTAHHNWNQVCNGGLTLGALAVADEEPDLAVFILNSALKSLPNAMSAFAPDGGWAEGPGYWNYTIRYSVPLIAGLTSALGTDFGLATANGFDRTGTFRLYFVGPTGKTFNYADAGEGAAERSPDMSWMARRFHQPLYAWEAQRAAGKGGGAMDLLWYEPVTVTPKAAHAPLDNLFRGVHVAFLRSAWEDSNAVWVGFKGGDNAANHSHLDLGTFAFEAMGERWAICLGSDNYNLPDYFGKARWTYYRLRTEGQNAPLLNNVNQDPKARAPLVAFKSAPETAYAVADLTKGYSPAGMKKVLRGVALVNNRSALLVQDEWASAKPVMYQWQIHTRAEILISANGRDAVLTQNGKDLSVHLVGDPGDSAAFAIESAQPAPLNNGVGPQQNPNTGIRRLVVRFPKPVGEGRIAVLLAPGMSARLPRIRPLNAWIKEAPPLSAVGGSLQPTKGSIP